MTFQAFANKLDVKYIQASSISSNAYILALHIAAITFDKANGLYIVLMRNISENQFKTPDRSEMDQFIRLQVAQFYVDTLCNVKEDIEKPRPVYSKGCAEVKETGEEIILSKQELNMSPFELT